MVNLYFTSFFILFVHYLQKELDTLVFYKVLFIFTQPIVYINKYLLYFYHLAIKPKNEIKKLFYQGFKLTNLTKKNEIYFP